METMLISNAHMGVARFHKDGIFPLNSSLLSRFSVPGKPIFSSSSKRGKKNKVFIGKVSKFVVISAITKEDPEKRLIEDNFIEKELKFKPAFDEYVLAMESFKVGVDKNTIEDIQGERRSAKLGRLRGNSPEMKRQSSGVRDERGKNEKFGNRVATSCEVSRFNRGPIEGETILKEKTSSRDIKSHANFVASSQIGYKGNDVWSKNNRRFQKYRKFDSAIGDGNNGYLERSGLSDYEKLYEVKETRQSGVKESSKSIERKINSGAGKGSVQMEKYYRNSKERKVAEPEFNNSVYAPIRENFCQTNLKKPRSMSDMYEQISEREGLDRRMDERKFKSISRYGEAKVLEVENSTKIQGRNTEVDGKMDRHRIQTERDGGYKNYLKNKHYTRPSRGFRELDEEDNVGMHRKAFETFEEFTDIRNRPRVLRMEMEERIQKLAKCLNGTDVNIPEWQFSKIMHSAEIKFTDHSILRIVQILGALGNWRRALQVVEWLQSRERFKSHKSKYIYTTVLDVLGKAKRPVEALNVFHAMRKQFSSYPDLAAYHCIAVTLGQLGHIKELFDVIDCMRALPEKKFQTSMLKKWDPRLEPDAIVYNAVLNACVRRKQWEGAFWVLQQLKEQHIQPSSTTYGLVMEVMLACGKYNLVHEFFQKVEKSSIPNALNYKVLVNALWKECKTDEAVSVVYDMEMRGIVGTASLYYDLARCLCSAGRPQEALQQVQKICKVATKPLVVTYTGLIQACFESGSVHHGSYIFNQMHDFCSPNIVTCNIMLKAYVEHRMFGEAKDLFEKILDGTHYISSVSEYKERIIPDKFTFNTMLGACVTEKKWDDFVNVYQQMLRQGFHFNVKHHLRMIMEALRAGKEEPLDATWDYLVWSGRVAPPLIIKERFSMKVCDGKLAAAIACIPSHQASTSHSFSEKAWLDLFNSNAHHFPKDTIVRLVHEVSNVIAKDGRPNLIFQNLLCSGREFINNHIEKDVSLPQETGKTA